MPVSNKLPYFSALASGADTYPFDFRTLDPADLVVTVAGDIQTMGTHYTVTLAADPGEGGSVVFEPGNVPAAGSGTVEIERVTSLDRSTDYQEAGGFRQTVVDKDFDRLVMMVQERDRKILVLNDQLTQAILGTTVPASDGSGRRFLLKIASGGPDENGNEILYPEITPL